MKSSFKRGAVAGVGAALAFNLTACSSETEPEATEFESAIENVTLVEPHNVIEAVSDNVTATLSRYADRDNFKVETEQPDTTTQVRNYAYLRCASRKVIEFTSFADSMTTGDPGDRMQVNAQQVLGEPWEVCENGERLDIQAADDLVKLAHVLDEATADLY